MLFALNLVAKLMSNYLLRFHGGYEYDVVPQALLNEDSDYSYAEPYTSCKFVCLIVSVFHHVNSCGLLYILILLAITLFP